MIFTHMNLSVIQSKKNLEEKKTTKDMASVVLGMQNKSWLHIILQQNCFHQTVRFIKKKVMLLLPGMISNCVMWWRTIFFCCIGRIVGIAYFSRCENIFVRCHIIQFVWILDSKPQSILKFALLNWFKMYSKLYRFRKND